MSQFSTGPSGALVTLATGQITGLTQAAPQTIDFRAYAAVGEYESFELIYKNLASSGGMAAGADPFFRLMVAGVAGATAYGMLYGDTAGAGQAYADTQVLLHDNSGVAQVTAGGGKITFENLFVNAKPFGFMATWSHAAAANTAVGKQGTWHRDVAAVHDGLSFGVNGVDVDTYSFDWILRAVRKL